MRATIGNVAEFDLFDAAIRAAERAIEQTVAMLRAAKPDDNCRRCADCFNQGARFVLEIIRAVAPADED